MYEAEKETLKNKKSYTVDDLRLIMQILRAPDGCAWDREQDHKSIVSSLIEETYEAIEAIEDDSKELLCEELGDILLQVVFHAQIEEEKGEAFFNDAVTGVCVKMIERHPHVFGDVKADTSEKVLENWEKIKSETKKEKSLSEKLNRIAKPLPALMRAQKVIHKTSKENVYPKEDLLEGDEERIGKMLFDVIRECDEAGLDAETVLRHYCDAFIKSV